MPSIPPVLENPLASLLASLLLFPLGDVWEVVNYMGESGQNAQIKSRKSSRILRKSKLVKEKPSTLRTKLKNPQRILKNHKAFPRFSQKSPENPHESSRISKNPRVYKKKNPLKNPLESSRIPEHLKESSRIPKKPREHQRILKNL